MPAGEDSQPLCPKCGKPVVKGGGLHDNRGAMGVQRYWCKPCKWHGTAPLFKDSAQSRGLDRKNARLVVATLEAAPRPVRLVITSAQNATPVHKRFLKTLLGYCKANRARLIVIPYRYKNPTSLWTVAAEHDDWWAAELAPYLLDERIDLNRHLTLLADVKTQPTSITPLMGLEALTGDKSGIIGHPKIELVAIPTPQAKLPKILTTTGAVTKKNYIPSKAGKKGEFHHTFGACLAEIEADRFFLRQINALNDGSFIDLGVEYDGGLTRKRRVDALVMGDTHVDFIDPGALAATFTAPDSIVKTLAPRILVWHDVLDFYSRSHHHRGDTFANYAKYHAGVHNVEQEIDRSFAFIDNHTPKDARNVIVASNHHEHFARWVRETDPKDDPENAVFWARTFEAMCLGTKMHETGAKTIDPFAWWARTKLRCYPQTTFLERNQSYRINGIDVAFHGDHGANGSRGSLRGYARIATKTVIGHTHTPGIRDGAYQVGGSSRLNLSYLRGPSSWMHTHCLIYPNGKRSLVNIVDGDWRVRV